MKRGSAPGWDAKSLEFLREGNTMLERAGVGVPQARTGRHPIDIMTRRSSCTTVAVRTHVPMLIDLQLVLVPLAGADQVMRDIARTVWPADPSPLEEQGYVAGRGHADEVMKMMLFSATRMAIAIEILRSFHHDADARRAALAALEGVE